MTPTPHSQRARTSQILDTRLDDHTDAAAAEALNAAGHHSGTGQPFTGRIVYDIRHANAIPSHADRLRARGMLTLDQIADRLAVHPATIRRWHAAGLLASHQANDKNERLYEPPTPGDPRLVKQHGWSLTDRECTQPHPGGAL